MTSELSRRRFVRAGVAAMGAMALSRSARAADSPRTNMGIVTYAMLIAQKADRSLSQPMEFVKACRSFGAGGAQVPLGVRDEAYTSALRRFCESNEMHLEAILELPPNRDEARLEQLISTAKAAGADLARTAILPGRRYEEFKSADQFRQAAKRATELVKWAEPILRRNKFRLAIENHKDQRIPERVDLLKWLGSEYIGACVDLGNSFALCEDPMDVVRALAPFALTVHIKDQQVREYEEGFMYGDAALGDGFLDVAEMVRVLRKANPRIHFNLESITRDPLKVPVMTEAYWATMGDVPATDLARTMRTVRSKGSEEPLPTISNLSPQQQVAAERRLIERSIVYAREHLQL